MGTFVTQQTEPELYVDKVAADLHYPQGLTAVNLPRAADFNALKNALSDVRNEIRGRAVYATHYGAKFDGVTDDTAAMQAALDVLSNSAGTGILVLPQSGTACISSTLTYVGNPSFGIVVRGESGSVFTGARLKYTGTLGGTLFRTRGMCRSSFWGVNFDANNLAKYAFLAEYNSANNGGSFYNSFFGCGFTNATGASSGAFAYGTALVDTFQVSEFDFYSCYASGTAANMGACYLQRVNGNTKNMRWWGGSSVGAQTPFDFSNASGSYIISGHFIGSHTVSAIKGGTTGFLHCDSVEVETSGTDQARFLDGTLGANAMSATLTNCDVNVKCPNDDFIIRWYGALKITGGQYWNSRQGAQTNIPKVAIAAQASIGSTGPGSVYSEGVYWANVTGDYPPFYDDGGNAISGTDSARNAEWQIESKFDYVGLFGSGTLTRLPHYRGANTREGWLEARNGTKAFSYSGMATRVVSKWSFTFSDFSAAAATKDLDVFEPKDGEGILRVRIKVTAAFTWGGGGSGTLNLRIGDSVGGQQIIKDRDATATAVYGDAAADFGTEFAVAMSDKGGVYSQASLARLKMRLTSSVSNLSLLNAGACTVWVVHEQLP